jgi:hypothetical protein
VRKIILVLAVVAAISAGSFAFGQSSPQAKVIAYYFHGAFRCVTCNNMEKYSKEAIRGNFKDELASGKLEFKAVNVEEKGNEHFVKDYQLYTKSLILAMVKDGKEIKSKNLDKIWELARNKQKFMNYVTGEVSTFMKDTQ